MPKTNHFQKNSSISLEQMWYEIMTEEDSAEVWENVLARSDVDDWRPDNTFTNSYGEELTLVEFWMKSLSRTSYDTSFPGWQPFFHKLKENYPHLSADVVNRAAISGVGPSGGLNDNLIIDWLNLYPYAWKDNQSAKNAILCEAIESDALILSKFLIDHGAEPQIALRFVPSVVSFNFLKGYSADPSFSPGRDPREIFFPHLKRDTSFDIHGKKTIFECLSGRDSASFKTPEARQQILHSIIQNNLKNGKTIENTDNRRDILNGAIKNSKTSKELISAVRASLPESLDWLFTDDDGATGSLMMIIAKSGFMKSALREFGHKIPENMLSERDSLGRTILEVALCSKNILFPGQWLDGEELFLKLSNLTPLSAKEAVRVTKYSKQSNNNELPRPICLIPSPTDRWHTDFHNIHSSEFLNECLALPSIDNKEMISELSKRLFRNSNTSDTTSACLAWANVFRANKTHPILKNEEWANFAVTTEMVSKKIQYPFQESDNEYNIIRTILDYWTHYGVNVRKALQKIPQDQESHWGLFRHIVPHIPRLLSYTERGILLQEHKSNANPEKNKTHTL